MLEIQPQKNQKQDFKKSFAISLAFHSLILSLFMLKIAFFSEPLIDLSQAISVSLDNGSSLKNLKPSLAQDDNKLPQKIQEPLTENIKPIKESKADLAEEKTEITKNKTANIDKKDEIDLKKTKAAQLSALNKLKKKSALDKIKEQLKSESINRIKSQLKNKGTSGTNKISAGTALSGLDKLQADNYLQVLDQSVKKHWALPQWLMNKPFKTKLLLKLGVQGQIISLKVISSSGNNSYDNYCIQAVEKAAPFVDVPEKLSEKFSVDGVVIGFPE